jgi:hypothetical protein
MDSYGEPYQANMTGMYRDVYLAVTIGWYGGPYQVIVVGK